MSDAGRQFTFTEFKEEYQTCEVHLKLATPEHQYMNVQVKVPQRTLRAIAHFLMIHARVSEAYIYFSLMYMADYIFRLYQSKI